jgi:hypothetical protein
MFQATAFSFRPFLGIASSALPLNLRGVSTEKTDKPPHSIFVEMTRLHYTRLKREEPISPKKHDIELCAKPSITP